jgi:hypothetical protein
MSYALIIVMDPAAFRPDCKIADNSDPLRGIFAFNSDPLLGESVNAITTYGFDPVTGMQEPKATLCQIRAA